jgi:hypothetical protein
LLPNARSLGKKKETKTMRKNKRLPTPCSMLAYMSLSQKEEKHKRVEEREEKAKFNSRQRIAGRGDQASWAWNSDSKSWSCFSSFRSNAPRLLETLVVVGVIDFVLVILALVVRALPWAS